LFQVKKTFSDYSAIPEKSAHTFKQHDDTYNKQCDSTHLNRDVKLQLSENSGKNSNGSNMNGGNDLNSIDHLTCDDTTDTKYHKRYNTDTCKAKDIICKQNSSSINDALQVGNRIMTCKLVFMGIVSIVVLIAIVVNTFIFVIGVVPFII
jgi:hypothetical protein